MSKNTSEKSRREKHTRFAEECAKLDPKVEQSLTEEGLAQDVATWPDYLTASEMRGFLKGIDTMVEREPDQV